MYHSNYVLLFLGAILLSSCIVAPTSQQESSVQVLKEGVIEGVKETNEKKTPAIRTSYQEGEESDEPLVNAEYLHIPTTDGGRWCLIDSSGTLLLEPKYKNVKSFQTIEDDSHLAPVQAVNGLWGYINEKGEEHIPPQFESARGFTEMFLARVEQNDKWGFINSSGKIIIPPTYYHVSPMTNGFAVASQKDQAFLIDKTGKPLGSKTFSRIGSFSENGLSKYRQHDGDGWGVLNDKGHPVTRPKFSFIGYFNQNNLAPAEMEVNDEELWGVIDQKGNWVVKPRYEHMDFSFDDTLLVARNDDFDEVVIDQNGKVILESPDREVQLSSACQRIWAGYRKRNFYDWDGRKIDLMSGKYSWFGSFDDSCGGLAYNNTQWGRLNSTGKFTAFSDEVAEPYTDDDRFIVNYNGEFMPAITQDRQLVYINQLGRIAFRAEVQKTTGGDIFVLKTPENEVLWQANFATGTLLSEQYLFFNAGDKETGFQKSWLSDITPAVQKLQSEKPRYFDHTSSAPYEVEVSDYSYALFGNTVMLAHYYLSETDLGQYDFMWDMDPVSGHFKGLRKQLTRKYGTPLPLDENQMDVLRQLGISTGDSAFSDDTVAVWKVDTGLLVLCDYTYIGDGDMTMALSLSLLPPLDTLPRPAAIDLDDVQTIETSDNSDGEVNALVRALPDNGDNPKVVRELVAKTMSLVGEGQAISEYDYLWTLYALLKFAYFGIEDGMSEEEDLKNSEIAVNYLEGHDVGSWVYTEIGQFKMEVYRAAGNSAAWALKDTDPKKALAFIESALEYARPEDGYMQDTYVRVLLNLGNKDRAYAIVEAILEKDPDFVDFQDFLTDQEYQDWLQSH